MVFTRDGCHNAHINMGRLLRRIRAGRVSDDSNGMMMTESTERASYCSQAQKEAGCDWDIIPRLVVIGVGMAE